MQSEIQPILPDASDACIYIYIRLIKDSIMEFKEIKYKSVLLIEEYIVMYNVYVCYMFKYILC